MRFLLGLTSQVNSTEELAQKDNFAFGVSVAGSILALGIVLTGAITGENAPSYLNGSHWHVSLRYLWLSID